MRSGKPACRCAIAKADDGAGNRAVRIGRAGCAHADRGGRIGGARSGRNQRRSAAGWSPLETTIAADLLAVAPRLSVTVPMIVYVPAALYVCEALEPLTGALPSPKLIVLETMLPSGSVDPAVEAVMLAGAVTDPVDGTFRQCVVMLSAAVGGWFAIVSCTPAGHLVGE